MGDFEASLNYSRNMGLKIAGVVGPMPPDPAVKEYVANAEKCRVGIKMRVQDGRKIGVDKFKLETHGFQLAQGAPRSMSKAAYYEHMLDSQKMAAHNKECEDVIARAMGGNCTVKVFHNLVRSTDAGNTKRGGGPAGAVHCDYSVASATGIFDGMAAKAGQRQGRFAVVNAWRNIADTPIERQYLAVCDGRSVVAPDDFTPSDTYQTAANGVDCKPTQNYLMDPSRAQTGAGHQWYYFPAMKADEILLFMQYDSHSATPSRYCFHTAVGDPRPEYADKPARESCETRCIVLFPDYKPDSIPMFVRRGEEKVSTACSKLLGALEHGKNWGEVGRNWMADKAWHQEPEEALNDWIDNCVKEKQWELHTFSAAERKALVRGLIDDGSFERTAKANFEKPQLLGPGPAPGAGSAAAEAAAEIIGSMQWGSHWPEAGRKWVAGLLNLKVSAAGVEQFARNRVDELKKKKSFGVERMSEAERTALVAWLINPASGFEAAARKGFC